MVDEEITANSSRGSNAIIAMFRSLIGFDRPDKTNSWCRFRVLKENLGIAPRPRGMKVTDKGLEFGDAPMRPRTDTAKDEAARWLQDRLKPGQTYKASEILEEAEQYGHNPRTIQRAATERMGIQPHAERKDGQLMEWTWTLHDPRGN